MQRSFSLRFSDAELERSYRLDFAEQTRRGARVLGVVAVAVLALAGIPEVSLVEPRWVPVVAAIRYGGIVASIAAAVGLTFSRHFHRWMDVAIVGVIAVVCAGYVAIAACYPREFGPTGLLGNSRGQFTAADAKFTFLAMLGEVVMIGATATSALRFVPGLVTGGVVLATITASAVVFGASPASVGYVMFLITPGVPLCVLGCRHMDRMRRENFLARRRIKEERARSEDLLLSILPRAIAERLRSTPGALADAFEDVSVLFADIVGFTPLAGKVPPTRLLAALNQLFSEFDRLTAARGLEKIKTIGDAYLVAGGLPQPSATHLEAMADLALEMMDAAHALARPDGAPFELRIGMHVGPAVAGVIGQKKLAYDLWGDTVNTASRMESHGSSGRVHVSDAVREQLKDRFRFELRGDIEIKGRGPMRTWYLVSRA